MTIQNEKYLQIPANFKGICRRKPAPQKKIKSARGGAAGAPGSGRPLCRRCAAPEIAGRARACGWAKRRARRRILECGRCAAEASPVQEKRGEAQRRAHPRRETCALGCGRRLSRAAKGAGTPAAFAASGGGTVERPNFISFCGGGLLMQALRTFRLWRPCFGGRRRVRPGKTKAAPIQLARRKTAERQRFSARTAAFRAGEARRLSQTFAMALLWAAGSVRWARRNARPWSGNFTQTSHTAQATARRA